MEFINSLIEKPFLKQICFIFLFFIMLSFSSFLFFYVKFNKIRENSTKIEEIKIENMKFELILKQKIAQSVKKQSVLDNDSLIKNQSIEDLFVFFKELQFFNEKKQNDKTILTIKSIILYEDFISFFKELEKLPKNHNISFFSLKKQQDSLLFELELYDEK